MQRDPKPSGRIKPPMPANIPQDDLLARARRIKLFLMDVDGTLTDGGIGLIGPLHAGADTMLELKTFHAQDGPGLSLAHTMGIKTGWITGRKSPVVTQRAKELHVTYVHLGQAQKDDAFTQCMLAAGVAEDEIAYMGDDLPDLPVAKRAGLAVCVADGCAELKAAAHYITERNGGRGTAREVVELILKAQGRWEEAVTLARA